MSKIKRKHIYLNFTFYKNTKYKKGRIVIIGYNLKNNNAMGAETTIGLENQVKDELDKLKANPKESYNEVIKRLIEKRGRGIMFWKKKKKFEKHQEERKEENEPIQ